VTAKVNYKQKKEKEWSEEFWQASRQAVTPQGEHLFPFHFTFNGAATNRSMISNWSCDDDDVDEKLNLSQIRRIKLNRYLIKSAQPVLLVQTRSSKIIHISKVQNDCKLIAYSKVVKVNTVFSIEWLLLALVIAA